MKKFLLGLSAFILPIIMYLGICISGFADIDSLYVAIIILFFVFDVLYIPIEMIIKKKLSLSTEEYNMSMFIGAFLSLIFPMVVFVIMENSEFDTFNDRIVASFTTFFGGLFIGGWIVGIIIIRLIYESVIRIKNRIISKRIKNNLEE